MVGHRGGPDIQNKKALEAYTLWMTGSSARIEYLEELRVIYPGINWQILTRAYNAEDLLQMVWNRSPLTVVDEHHVHEPPLLSGTECQGDPGPSPETDMGHGSTQPVD